VDSTIWTYFVTLQGETPGIGNVGDGRGSKAHEITRAKEALINRPGDGPGDRRGGNFAENSSNLELGDTTVFIGPNNGGKTAILDAVRIALTRRWGQRGTGFTEYDVHLATEHDDPKASPGVVIEIRAEEVVAGEWPDELLQDLEEIYQLDPA
jgi:hypothetical protein